VRNTQAIVQQRQAQLSQAEVDLGRTRIVSPVSGIVIKRAVEPGQTVAASLQAPEMFVIAQNLSDMQVETAIDEADVGRVKAGQKVSFTVDAFPTLTFEGELFQVRKAAQNVSNVVTYVAVVRFQNPDGKLLPGMTANVRIVTDSRDDVLKVPNSALRVRLPDVQPQGEQTRARLHVLGADGKPQAFYVRAGLSDGSSTEVRVPTEGPAAQAIREGATVITGAPAAQAGTGGGQRPGAGGPRPPF
jgi:HlyD family secretion protein